MEGEVPTLNGTFATFYFDYIKTLITSVVSQAAFNCLVTLFTKLTIKTSEQSHCVLSLLGIKLVMIELERSTFQISTNYVHL